jgi:hypothetical protein
VPPLLTRLPAPLAHAPAAGSEIWNITGGRMTHKGKQSVIEDAFADAKLVVKSGANTPAKSRDGTPAASAAASGAATPAGSGGEGTGSPMPKKKKKKLTRNQYVFHGFIPGRSLTPCAQDEGAGGAPEEAQARLAHPRRAEAGGHGRRRVDGIPQHVASYRVDFYRLWSWRTV